MFINGKKVKHISESGVVYTMADCKCCGNPGTYCFKASFDDDWNDTLYVDVCPECLIDDGWFVDDDDIKEAFGKTTENYLY